VEFRQAVVETGPFGRRCLSILPCSPFPLPAHQTGRADFHQMWSTIFGALCGLPTYVALSSPAVGAVGVS
jgi:hypothetical protein